MNCELRLQHLQNFDKFTSEKQFVEERIKFLSDKYQKSMQKGNQLIKSEDESLKWKEWYNSFLD